MIGNSNPQQHFNGLDEKTKKSIWYILELARLEYDNLHSRRPPERGWHLYLDTRFPQNREDTRDSIDKKTKLLQPLSDLSKAIKPTSLSDLFLKTTADLMAVLSVPGLENLNRALSDHVYSMTRR
jgi:hypothetical protein